ncbi:hypothetical protein GCM10019059_04330 [Camelimonas fluminis]|uniref:Glycosyltransferase n=1 Tax=Camelimonas fluminis TaxID=1576911 RepID=A0ABV7UC90_9HYPH|nr:glycosyltransferase [Camelimonas fluminis]GHE48606.1 hypothetical protein GCM10019059_04330 [Camelimonas fluminis]
MSLRIAIVVTHLLGVGHLTRAASLARALAARGHVAQIISGGQPATLLRIDGVELIQLPPLHVVGTAFSNLREEGGAPLRPETARRRIAIASKALEQLQPHVLVTELFPFGRRALGAEFQAILDAAQGLARPPLVLASVRDILARPAKQAKIDAAHALLRARYDGVLVHSDPAVVPLEASWPIADDLKPSLHYTGYVDDNRPAAPPPATAPTRAGIVVSGGGSAAALPLLHAALAAATSDPERRVWRLLVGHKVAEAAMTSLRHAAPANAIIERARPDFRDLLRRCAASVSQCGYNTALDILATGAPAVVVPFAEGGETEQAQRAALFAARGLVQNIALEEVTATTLLAAVSAAQASGGTSDHGVAVNGADCSAQLIERLAADRPAIASPGVTPLITAIAAALGPVKAALDHAGDAGRSVAFWHRDDDAVAPTPQLERLLELTRAHHAPLAIAAIPARATSELADRLAGEPHVAVLVHGLNHENLAPANAKKGEFSHGDPEELARRAGEGLARIHALFGAQTRPVFTPPWNRASPALTPRLAGAGFTGLSTFRRRPARFAAPGLAQVNAHIDPIAWRGDRSLVGPADLAEALCQAIAGFTAPAADPEPIGLLTHHLVHDARIDAFVAILLGLIAAHPAARMTAIDDALSQGAAAQ